MRKIDAYTHVMPEPYLDALDTWTGGDHISGPLAEAIPELWDVEARLELMDRHGIDEHVLVPGTPPVETVADPIGAAKLARVANDSIAEIVADHPDRFRGVATVPMNDPEAMVAELDRAILDLELIGVLLYTSIDTQRSREPHPTAVGRPIDNAGFEPFYDRVSELGVPIWLHPTRPATRPDYVGESASKYLIWQLYGWPYETTAAMARLVFNGVLDRHDLSVITHHSGAMIPHLAGRIQVHYDLFEMDGTVIGEDISSPYLDHFEQFFADTSIASAPALRTAHEFFGTGNLLFGTDAPFDPEGGSIWTERVAGAVDSLDIPSGEREQIYGGNLERLLG